MAMHIDKPELVDFDPVTFARLSQAYQRLERSEVVRAWHFLEALHVLGQTRPVPHGQSRWFMLGLAWRTRDLSEASGQVLRLLLVPLGHLLGRLPMGNTGRAAASAFRPMPASPALLATIHAFQQSSQG